MTIPVTNLFYLYAYAWRRFSAIQDREFIVESAPSSVQDLWALVLIHGFGRQVRRGLDHTYRTRQGPLQLPRGRFDPMRSVATGALATACIACQWDEFVPDTIANRIIKATMRRLAACAGVDQTHARRMGVLWRGLNQVEDVTPTLALIRSVQLNRNNATYGLLLDVCALVLQHLLPRDHEGELRFRDPRRDDIHMARVFQDFLASWFDHHREAHAFDHVGATRLLWPAEAMGDPEDLKLLPSMMTDVTLQSPSRVLIIDAKYYSETLAASRFDASRKVIAGHLYQLYAYLSAWRHEHPHGPMPEGMLMYPTVTEEVDLAVRVHGFPVRVRTLNLGQEWREIDADMRELARG